MNRGYSLDRGKGIRRRGTRRGVCSNCNRRGMGTEHVIVAAGVARVVRQCRYCSHAEVRRTLRYASETETR